MKKNKDNLKYILDKFALDNVSAPESLSEENIAALLDSDKPVSDIKIAKKKSFKGAKTLAASLAVVVLRLPFSALVRVRLSSKMKPSLIKIPITV